MDKKIIVLGVLIVLIIASLLVINNTRTKVSSNKINDQKVGNLHQVNLAIKGMDCESCAFGVSAQLKDLEGVIDANIDYKTATGIVLYDEDKVDPERIAAASTAYPAQIISIEKKI